ncbi:MAG TPA: hypothetical protein VK430_13065 [Xanthobacteraceae bacterium]|nr:hypothetical protein [Xanthobacteraceae bacterium]
MSTEMPPALAGENAQSPAEAAPAARKWFATALTASFTAAAVLFVSFLAVVTGLL